MKAYEIIRNKRRDLGISQEKLGELTGYSQQAIQKIENGTRNLSEEKIRIFAKALNLAPSELFNETEMPGNYKEQIREIIIGVERFLQSAKRALSPEDKASLIIALYEDTQLMSPAERNKTLENFTKLYLKTKAS